MSKRGHRTFGLFAHVTWHTWRRTRSVRRADVEVVASGILESGLRNGVHILAQAIIADHVHVLVSMRPDRPLTPFIRDAKSESARRANAAGGQRRRPRGHYGGSLPHADIPGARTYRGK